MNRLTFRDEDGDVRFVEICDQKGNPLPISQQHPIWAHRLAAYEDTGLTPEERNKFLRNISELEKQLDRYTHAEADGRLLVLPCSLGTTVYRIHRVFGESSISEEGFTLSALDKDYGVTVFRTREEAEAALGREQHGD